MGLVLPVDFVVIISFDLDEADDHFPGHWFGSLYICLLEVVKTDAEEDEKEEEGNDEEKEDEDEEEEEEKEEE